MSKTLDLPENVALLPAAERQIVDEFTEAIRRHQEQGAATLVRLARLAFEMALAARKQPREGRLALALARGLESRQQLAEAEGGSLSSDEVARLLGMSKTAVLKRRDAGKLLAWREERLNTARFPRWQFDEQGRVLEGLPEVLQRLAANERLDDRARILFFLQERSDLGGKRPLDYLRSGRLKDVCRAAEAYAG